MELNFVKPIIFDRIIAKYKITYKNGIIQEKNLISHLDYIGIIKPYKEIIYTLEKEKLEKDANLLKTELKIMFGFEWFTDKSPLFEASKTGILKLLKSQGGDHFCKVECI